jgi:THO complex subunit 5
MRILRVRVFLIIILLAKQDTDRLRSHKYQQLPLITVEEFLQGQPEHGDDGEKTLMFARIHHELKEREELENARQELLKKKQSLIADNQKWKDDLASLDKDLETFIDVRTPWSFAFTLY